MPTPQTSGHADIWTAPDVAEAEALQEGDQAVEVWQKCLDIYQSLMRKKPGGGQELRNVALVQNICLRVFITDRCSTRLSITPGKPGRWIQSVLRRSLRTERLKCR